MRRTPKPRPAPKPPIRYDRVDGAHHVRTSNGTGLVVLDFGRALRDLPSRQSDADMRRPSPQEPEA